MKWLLLALGGYVLYEYFYGTPAISSSAAGTTTVTSPTGSVGTTTVVTNPPPVGTGGSGSVAPVVSGVSAASLQKAAGGAASLTPQQWNYYYSALTGQPVSASHSVSASNIPIDVNTYLARRATAGLGGSVQGLSRWSPDYGNVGKYFRGM